MLRALAGATAVTLGLAVLVAPPSASSASPQPAVVAPAPVQKRASLLDEIRAIPIVTHVTEVKNAPRGTRFFRIKVSVPVDYADPQYPTFELRVNLLHRGFDRPTVVETSGYRLWDDPYRSEVTRIVDGNQLDIEHRFFSPSLPKHPDWGTQLTIRQVADDDHRVVSAFRHLYDGNWLSTGDSKGGMAATYFRRFYPTDVNATIAYVAPNDVVDDVDAYPTFLAEIGGKDLADCRSRLVALQRRMLTDRGWFRGRLSRFSAEKSLTWDYVGSLDRGFEASVVDMYFAYWQYWGERACKDVPIAKRMSNAQVWRYAGSVEAWGNLADQRRYYSLPYHFQAATQIGGPQPYERPLRDLLRYPGADTPANILPPWMKPAAFDPDAMVDIDAWVRTDARRMMFIDGQDDPWSAEPFRCGADAQERSCVRLVVPHGTHGAVIGELRTAQRDAAERLIRRWAGLRGVSARGGAWGGSAAWDPRLDDRYRTWVANGRRRGSIL
ncbi:S28 family serine protease [Nocardioides humilatus]|uniref:S28 family serine protease n=1 Tax=Nocardioides humilatus TaxID=2607660 RepID=UPI00165F00D5|nr:S28 family serine protease [Nocardioides humilatus]